MAAHACRRFCPGPCAVWVRDAGGNNPPDKALLPALALRGWSLRRCREEVTVEEHVVWMTTRQIKPGTLADFERAWRPGTHPEGMVRAYAYWSEDEREIVGVSFWASRQSCDAW